jgi:hypothetical protein
MLINRIIKIFYSLRCFFFYKYLIFYLVHFDKYLEQEVNQQIMALKHYFPKYIPFSQDLKEHHMLLEFSFLLFYLIFTFFLKKKNAIICEYLSLDTANPSYEC